MVASRAARGNRRNEERASTARIRAHNRAPMDERSSAEVDRSARWFLLGAGWTPDRPLLEREEQEHVLRVLRAKPGLRLIGFDGAGAVLELEVVRAAPRELELVAAGPLRIEAAPGEGANRSPWIEIALTLPRAARAEEMLGRLTQLGVVAISPLVCERTQGGANDLGAHRRTRLERILREACKQSKRATMPVLGEELSLDDWLTARSPASIAAPHPGADERLFDWALRVDRARFGRRDAPIAIVLGPEGGFSERELARLDELSIRRVALGPHVLRIETAAEAAAATLAQVWLGSRESPSRSASET